MALEAVCFQQGLFGCTMKELYRMESGGLWSCDFGGSVDEEGEEKGMLPWNCETGGGGGGGNSCNGLPGNWGSSCSTLLQDYNDWDVNNTLSSPEAGATDGTVPLAGQKAKTGRRKRRRTRSPKSEEEVKNQRMTHIAVERNRRKQMNEYLAVLRSLTPASYVQRGDQASIIGGAINFVKKLEQLVQSLEVQKRIKQRSDEAPFADFFTFPQYSSSTNPCKNTSADGEYNSSDGAGAAAKQSSVADIEVTMVESHANLKVLSRRQPKQLLKLVVGLQSFWLTTLHLNVTTIDEMVLYSFSLKVEDECQLTTVDEIAHAVHQMVQRIQKDAAME